MIFIRNCLKCYQFLVCFDLKLKFSLKTSFVKITSSIWLNWNLVSNLYGNFNLTTELLLYIAMSFLKHQFNYLTFNSDSLPFILQKECSKPLPFQFRSLIQTLCQFRSDSKWNLLWCSFVTHFLFVLPH